MAGKLFYPSLLWNISDSPGTIYLSFDDGPIPEVTPWVLSLLKDYHAKATFFCIGDNIRKNPAVFRQVQSEGHSIGNHTYHHLNGWSTAETTYLENVLLAEKTIQTHQNTDPCKLLSSSQKLFRPPYGKITPNQIRQLKKRGYNIVMWDVISMDFDKNTSADRCLKNVITHATEGSIIVFHDSMKAFPILKQVLPKVLEYYSGKNFKFKAL